MFSLFKKPKQESEPIPPAPPLQHQQEPAGVAQLKEMFPGEKIEIISAVYQHFGSFDRALDFLLNPHRDMGIIKGNHCKEVCFSSSILNLCRSLCSSCRPICFHGNRDRTAGTGIEIALIPFILRIFFFHLYFSLYVFCRANSLHGEAMYGFSLFVSAKMTPYLCHSRSDGKKKNKMTKENRRRAFHAIGSD